ncbi:MAG TPA: GAF domain-containing protein, partial [Roseiflexaceae bacterium]|nr:GAF domain-containing protein [Roseiflexaceae bacterium]
MGIESQYQRLLDVVDRVSKIAADPDLSTLLDRSLALFIELAGAEAGTLYLYDAQRDELVFHVVRGDETSTRLVGSRFPSNQGVAGAALQSDQPIFVSDVQQDPRWNRSVGELARLTLRTMYCLPLSIAGRPVGVVQVFNLSSTMIDDDGELALLNILASTMVSVIDKTRMLLEAERRERRQRALADVQARLTRTLERTELLHLIMNYARDLLEVEATSVWELVEDLDTGDRMLRSHVATGEHGEQVTGISIPFGQGIIGRVVATGEVILVDDVRQDDR